MLINRDHHSFKLPTPCNRQHPLRLSLAHMSVTDLGVSFIVITTSIGSVSLVRNLVHVIAAFVLKDHQAACELCGGRIIDRLPNLTYSEAG